jgi:hypothetical protein
VAALNEVLEELKTLGIRRSDALWLSPKHALRRVAQSPLGLALRFRIGHGSSLMLLAAPDPLLAF